MRKPNFKKITNQILKSYQLTGSGLAKKLGVTPAAVSHLSTGQTEDPRFSLGQKLLELHEKRPKDTKAA